MRKDCITFRSITPAQRAQRILRRNGVESVLQRTPSVLQERGCGYCLRVAAEDTARAERLLKAEGVVYSRVVGMGAQMP